jgi:hypothetical protein
MGSEYDQSIIQPNNLRTLSIETANQKAGASQFNLSKNNLFAFSVSLYYVNMR